MATYTPDSNIQNFFDNPTNNVPRVIFNSGYPITESMMTDLQKFMDNTVANNFRAMIKYPGIVKQSS